MNLKTTKKSTFMNERVVIRKKDRKGRKRERGGGWGSVPKDMA